MKGEKTIFSEQSIITQLAVMSETLVYLKLNVSDIKDKLESNYVSKEEFAPIAKIVYGLVSVILLAVVGALVALVLKK